MVVIGIITCGRLVHRECVHHILEDEVDGQKEGQGDQREDGEEGEEERSRRRDQTDTTLT